MKVEIWSDVVCPWCYVGKRRFEAALARFAHRADVDVEWRAFELDQTATSAGAGDPVAAGEYADRLAAKYGTTRDGAQQMIDTMTAAAAEEGLDLRFDRAVRANTFAAHQLIRAAREHGLQEAVQERLLRAYFTEGEAVGDRAVLVRLAAEAGLDAQVARDVLDGGAHAEAVREEEREAFSLGVRGVPFFVIDRRYGVSGAQPAEHLLQALDQAWAEARPLTVLGTQDGQGASDAGSCGPDGCAV